MRLDTKIIFAAAAIIMLVSSCCRTKPALLDPDAFQTEIDGAHTDLYTLRGGKLVMQVTNFGARVVSLWVPDRKGNYADVEIGYENIDRYIHNDGERFLGAVVGPYANRIAHGTFSIDGKQYNFPLNNNGNTLHGGLKGLDCVVWEARQIDDSSIEFHYLHTDGQEGFPGNLDITMTYSLTPANEFKVTYIATTDAPTHVNLSHHSFFNLKGEAGGTIEDHVLMIQASNSTPVDELLIPDGSISDIRGSALDFTAPHAIGDRIREDNIQLHNGRGYDHNWIIDRDTPDEVELVASLYEPASGRFMEVLSDQPALQFYSGNFFDGSSVGKYGKPLKFRESVALETQKYPDSPHHTNFSSTLLLPGETYTHTCIYRFSTK